MAGSGNIIYEPQNPIQHPAIVAGSLPVKVKLAGSVLRVQSGCPLRPSPAGWVVATDGFGELIAQDAAWGGEECQSFRAAIVEMYRPNHFEPGHRYAFDKVTDTGLITFKLDMTGPFIAMSETKMLMDMSVCSVFNRTAAMVAQRAMDEAKVKQEGGG